MNIEVIKAKSYRYCCCGTKIFFAAIEFVAAVVVQVVAVVLLNPHSLHILQMTEVTELDIGHI